ncbi:MAG TPA: glycosyltransferase, partial [Solirubrobacteraceae bacterium]|nr:glycosyltransferase [Solirubrobacteraceae bacterium]
MSEMPRLPHVTCVMTAYQYGRFLPQSLDSVLAQDYPAELLDVVVVDDGSTDDTPVVLARYAAAHPQRITVVRQRNAGTVAAINRGLELARGELIAILDADDAWLPHKTRTQVEMLQANPRLGLVHSDMTAIDGDGEVVAESWFRLHDTWPESGRVRGVLIGRNIATNSTIMMRADLRHAYWPLPSEAEVPCQDWWFAAQVAAHAEIDLPAEPLVLYRRHGSNKSPDRDDAAHQARNARRLIRQIRHLLGHTLAQEVTARDLLLAVFELDRRAAEAQRLLGTRFARLAEITDDDRAAAERELAAGGRDVERMFAAARAIA